jgi:hypothetical protein
MKGTPMRLISVWKGRKEGSSWRKMEKNVTNREVVERNARKGNGE